MFNAVLTITLVTILTFFLYIKYRHSYWKRKRVPYIKPTSLILGNLETLVGGQSVGIVTAKFYEYFKKRGVKFGGVYLLINPVLVLVDLELIKNVMSKDSQYFINRGVYYNEKHDPLAPDLFNIGGVRWKNVRLKISPNYTSGKMKAAFKTMLECCKRMEKVVENCDVLDIKELFCCYTTDLNFLCSFGFECNSLESDCSFRNYGKKFFNADLWKQIKHTLSVGMPEFSRNIGIVTRNKEVSQFWLNLFLDTIKYRETENYKRDDLLEMLIEMKDERRNVKDGKTLEINEIAAHALLFFIASFETSSSAMTFCMYEIAKDLEIQRKIREEIQREELTYDGVMNLKYLRQVLDGKTKSNIFPILFITILESMRKYPPIPTLNRECVKDYRIPGTDVIIEKGTSILIPVFGLHHDEDYYTNSQQFNPERFNEKNKGKIPSHAYLPFGEGPRNCIGMFYFLFQLLLLL